MTGLELTVAVIAHNRADIVDDTLAAIADQEWDGDWDVVLVDNDSSDATPDILEAWVDKMPVPARVVRANAGRGPSYARNTAVAATNATSVAFVDDDDLIAEGWVAAVGEALRNHALVGSRYDYERLNPPELAAATNFQTEGLGSTTGTATITGGGMGCHRDVWNAVGGQDEDLRYGEDIDFCLRVAKQGAAEPHFCPDAVYHFRLRTGAGEAWRRGMKIGRSSVRLYKEHGRGLGARPDKFGVVARSWIAYAARIPGLRNAARRAVWAGQLGIRIGRLRGSIAERVWYP